MEFVGGDLEETVAVGGLFIHPIGELKFILAYGVEHEHEGDQNEFVFRTGVYYDFFIGKFSISPNINVDFVGGDQDLVYGVAVGFGF